MQPQTTNPMNAPRILVVGAKEMTIRPMTELADELLPGDVLVVNDAATLPASLSGWHERSQKSLEARLIQPLDDTSAHWLVALLGAGTFRTPTELRAAPPVVAAGDRLVFRNGVQATVTAVTGISERLVKIMFLEGKGLAAIYAAGLPVQYAHRRRPVALWEHQTLFANQPVALEPPSSAMHLKWESIFAAKAKGVEVLALTHATGISSTGDSRIDALLPFPERSHIPLMTAARIIAAKTQGRRIVAVGTGAMRALECAARDGVLQSGHHVSTIRINAHHRRKIVNGIVSGLHEEGSSHRQLLSSFIPPATLEHAQALAERAHLRGHELGDTCLIWGPEAVVETTALGSPVLQFQSGRTKTVAAWCNSKPVGAVQSR